MHIFGIIIIAYSIVIVLFFLALYNLTNKPVKSYFLNFYLRLFTYLNNNTFDNVL